MQETNLSPKTKISLLKELMLKTKNNHSLALYATENLFVPGMGPEDAEIMVIGEAPGKEEALQGKPFVGRSGQLLSRLLEEENLSRSMLFITNVVKYRPPNNKTPTYKECRAWAEAYLHQEIAIICPKIIITLGNCAARMFLGEKVCITNIQGKVFDIAEIKIIPMYHPAYLLRNKQAIQEVKKSLKNVKQIHTEIVHNYVHNMFTTCA